MLLIGHGVELFPSKNSQLPTISNDAKIRMLWILASKLLLYSGLQQNKHMREYIPVVCLRLVDNWHGFHHKGHALRSSSTTGDASVPTRPAFPVRSAIAAMRLHHGRRKRPHLSSTPPPPLRECASWARFVVEPQLTIPFTRGRACLMRSAANSCVKRPVLMSKW